MKGYIPVEIPTKRYIKAYVHALLGDKPLMSTDHRIGNKLYDLLERNTNEDRKRFANARYNARLKLYIPLRTYHRRGVNLNESNIKRFNNYIEKEIKHSYRMLMDFYIDILPSFEAHLPEVRKRLGIDIEAWDDDSIRKDYYRYRKEAGKPLFYAKKFAVTVPSEGAANKPF